jgi:hypothetical protein
MTHMCAGTVRLYHSKSSKQAINHWGKSDLTFKVYLSTVLVLHGSIIEKIKFKQFIICTTASFIYNYLYAQFVSGQHADCRPSTNFWKLIHLKICVPSSFEMIFPVIVHLLTLGPLLREKIQAESPRQFWTSSLTRNIISLRLIFVQFYYYLCAKYLVL